MSWREGLIDASFRGIYFEVEATKSKFGRRTTRHEYPKRDTPAIEDLGRATRELQMTAFIIGDDYMARRDELIEAAEEPGKGVLAHPFIGELDVYCEAFELSETTADGGMATIAFSFVEAGELSLPTANSEAASAAGSASAKVIDDSLDNLLKAFDDALDAVGDAMSAVNAATDAVRDALHSPGKIVGKIGAAVAAADAIADNIADLATNPTDLAAQVEKLFTAIADADAIFLFLKASPPVIDATTNEKAIAHSYAQNGLAAAGLALVSDEFDTYEEAEEAANKFAFFVDTEAANTSGAVFDSLSSLKNAVIAAIYANAIKLPKLKTIDVFMASSIPLAFELYGDAERADEITRRNKIAHGGFISGALRVLSE
jgi:prophage DNA circulation protein